jgi:mannose-1-phosphate guanylyltransferase
MKAILLAAGLGTRLRPLTDRTPKCLVPILGRPLLDIWLDTLGTAGVDDVLVNLHHLPEQVTEHLARRAGGPRVQTVFEPTLVGSAGTLAAARSFIGSDETFLAVNGDNLTDFDLRRLAGLLERTPTADAAIAVFKAPRPEQCGILEVVDGVVASFEEKPSVPRSDLANAGLYAFRRSVLDLVPEGAPVDIGTHLLPRLVGRAVAVPIGEHFLIDIGTPEALARAEAEWPRRRGAA